MPNKHSVSHERAASGGGLSDTDRLGRDIKSSLQSPHPQATTLPTHSGPVATLDPQKHIKTRTFVAVSKRCLEPQSQALTANHPTRSQDRLIAFASVIGTKTRQKPVNIRHGCIVLTDRSRGECKTTVCIMRNGVKLARRQSRAE